MMTMMVIVMETLGIIINTVLIANVIIIICESTRRNCREENAWI